MGRAEVGSINRRMSAWRRNSANRLPTPVLDWRVSDTIMLDMWEKLTFLSTLAGITCLMRASVGDILAAPGGAQAITRFRTTDTA